MGTDQCTVVDYGLDADQPKAFRYLIRHTCYEDISLKGIDLHTHNIQFPFYLSLLTQTDN